MAGLELFANQAQTVVSSGGATTPSAGTSETWTVTSSAALPAASSTASPPTFFRITDVAASSEKMLVTNVSGTTWTVTRGAEGTTPVLHAAGFTVQNVITAAALAALVNMAGKSPDWVNVVSAYGADPTGAADSTAAFQAALTAAGSAASSDAAGGVVYAPAGTYKITPPSATVPALTVPSGVIIQGAGMRATSLLKNGNGILLDFSGPGPISQTDAWNLNQGLRDLTLDSNGTSGLLERLYYLQFYFEENVLMYGATDVSVDMAQCFDSRVTNGIYLYGGSASASALSGGQAVFYLIRNSASAATTLSSNISGTVTALPVAALPAAIAAGIVQVWNSAGQVQNFTTTGAASAATSIPVTSVAVAHTFVSGDAVNGFGWSGDSTNALVMTGCHWEDMISGAFWITPGINNSSQPNAIHIVNTKIEMDTIGYNCPQVQVDPGCSGIDIDHLYLYLGGYNGGYSTRVPGIYFHPDNGNLSNVFELNGADVTTAGIDAGSTAFSPTVSNVFQYWNYTPTTAGINCSAGTVNLVNCQVTGTVTTPLAGTYRLLNDASGNNLFTGLTSLNGGSDTSGTAVASVPTFVSGTAKQLSTVQDVILYVNTHTTAGATFSLAMGSTSAAANTVVASAAAPITDLYTVRVPRGWYVKMTFTSADVSFLQVTC